MSGDSQWPWNFRHQQRVHWPLLCLNLRYIFGPKIDILKLIFGQKLDFLLNSNLMAITWFSNKRADNAPILPRHLCKHTADVFRHDKIFKYFDKVWISGLNIVCLYNCYAHKFELKSHPSTYPSDSISFRKIHQRNPKNINLASAFTFYFEQNGAFMTFIQWNMFLHLCTFANKLFVTKLENILGFWDQVTVKLFVFATNVEERWWSNNLNLV